MDYNLNLDKLQTPEDIQKLKSAISEAFDQLDVMVVTTAPNGNISGREGQLCLYNNSSVYTVWVCTSGTTWQQVGASETDWTDYSGTSTIVGWSSFTVQDISYKKIGKTVFVRFRLEGTSNATTASFTVPVNPVAGNNYRGCAYTVDNGTPTSTGGVFVLLESVTRVDIYKDMASTAWTNSGDKTAEGQFWYEAAS